MQAFDWAGLSPMDLQKALARPVSRLDPRIAETVRAIFDDVSTRGAEAVADWATRLDGAAPRCLPLDEAALAHARLHVAPEDLEALAYAADNVRAFMAAEKPTDGPVLSPRPGLKLQRLYRPLTTAGLYVPGGTAPLFSTLLMLAIPATVAGVTNPVAITPPGKNGNVHPMMVLAAHAAGLERLWLVGGAHGISALTYGTLSDETGRPLPRADKLFGPGNAYVTEAKRQAANLSGGPATDMPAGPSELLVIADASADPDLVAADLLSQAEHDTDAQVVLVSPSEALIKATQAALERQLATLPRADIARKALAEARAIRVRSLDEAAEVSNAYAPEHLSLQVEDPDSLIPHLTAAGTVFSGRGAAETFGDYAAGPSHVLPTDGAARAWDGITVRSFMTSFVVQSAEGEGRDALARASARLARLEGLEAHARAADYRLSLTDSPRSPAPAA